MLQTDRNTKFIIFLISSRQYFDLKLRSLDIFNAKIMAPNCTAYCEIRMEHFVSFSSAI